MSSTSDTQDAVRLREAAGAKPELATAIAAVAARSPRPTIRAALGATLGSAVPTVIVPLLIAAAGWFIMGELRQIRTELTDQGERLTRVAAILELRLPATG